MKKLSAAARWSLDEALRLAEQGPSFSPPPWITEPAALYAERARQEKLWRDSWLVPRLRELVDWDDGKVVLR